MRGRARFPEPGDGSLLSLAPPGLLERFSRRSEQSPRPGALEDPDGSSLKTQWRPSEVVRGAPTEFDSSAALEPRLDTGARVCPPQKPSGAGAAAGFGKASARGAALGVGSKNEVASKMEPTRSGSSKVSFSRRFCRMMFTVTVSPAS